MDYDTWLISPWEHYYDKWQVCPICGADLETCDYNTKDKLWHCRGHVFTEPTDGNDYWDDPRAESYEAEEHMREQREWDNAIAEITLREMHPDFSESADVAATDLW